MIEKAVIVMYEKAEEVQNFFEDADNREFPIRYYQYPSFVKHYERAPFIGVMGPHIKFRMSTLSCHVWLPEIKHFERMIPHMNLIDLDNKFTEFKRMFYENHWFDDEVDTLEGRGEDPFDYFKTYDELWLGFVMIDRYRKRWDGQCWVTTDIYPDYFEMNALTAHEDGYPAPDMLGYIPGLRGVVEK
jgi:hypothetical protein